MHKAREQDQMTTVQIQKPNLTSEEIRYAVKKLGREPNEVEWAMLEAQWSEHCSYKSSKPLLRLLPSKGPESNCRARICMRGVIVSEMDGWLLFTLSPTIIRAR